METDRTRRAADCARLDEIDAILDCHPALEHDIKCSCAHCVEWRQLRAEHKEITHRMDREDGRDA